MVRIGLASAASVLLSGAPFGSALQMSPSQASPGSGDHCMHNGESRRVAFFHVPKTGTSLGNMIAHYVNASLPEGAVVPDCTKEQCTHAELDSQGQLEFQYRYPVDVWFRDCLWMKDGHGPDKKDWFSHHEVSKEDFAAFKGRFVGLFRRPDQRALSSFHSFKTQRIEQYRIYSEDKWAKLIEGTATKMLAGQEFPIEVQPFASSRSYIKPKLDLALSRLNEGFMFVGLLERYALSVCLFHTITESKCLRHDVDNMRKNDLRGDDDEWDTSVLNGYTDPYDTVLYKAARDRFWKDVNDFKLTADHCQSLCPWMEKSAFFKQSEM